MPSLPHNIEPSAFRQGDYIGYPASGPGIFRIRKRERRWIAHRYAGGCLIPGSAAVVGKTLQEVGEKLAAL